MAEIKVLDNTIINQIAAGEVVERPASVVKELVENAIDAGAKAVTVEIRDGGTSLIRVTDNGSGIAADQLRAAFLRHATSKIRDMEDLENVLTLGFRGEALSSIAGVAQVEVITKTAAAESGRRLEIHGGEVIAEEDIGCADGTSFAVRNLFYNVPARRKFLKKPAVESGYISDVLSKIAIGHPEVAVKYVNNATVVLQTNGADDMKTAVFHVYGREIATMLIPVDAKRDGFRLTGFIARPETARANRTYENFFINGRYVKCVVVQNAAEEAFKTRLPVGKFPVFVLHLQMPPSFVDVNVHPTKLEVRFSDERFIYDLIFDALDAALRGESLIPRVEPHVKAAAAEEPVVPIFEKPPAYGEQSLTEAVETAPVQASAGSDTFALPDIAPIGARKLGVMTEMHEPEGMPAMEMQAQQPAAGVPFFHTYKIVGQLFRTYWIVEQNESVYVIDQHAAHERVLFETYLERLKKGAVVTQQLVSPVAVKLSLRESEIVREHGEFLQLLGFELDELGEQSFALRALPYVFDKPAEPGLFTDIIDALTDTTGAVGDLYDARLTRIATMACKAAVKGNDRLVETEARALLEQLLRLENPFTCPHGRPTVVEMTKYEFEKMFKRVQ